MFTQIKDFFLPSHLSQEGIIAGQKAIVTELLPNQKVLFEFGLFMPYVTDVEEALAEHGRFVRDYPNSKLSLVSAHKLGLKISVNGVWNCEKASEQKLLVCTKQSHEPRCAWLCEA